MARREVRAPDGSWWVVRRRWASRLGHESQWSRFRRRTRGTVRWALRIGDGADGCFVEEIEALVLVVVVIVVVLLAIFVVIPLLVAIVDILILLLIGLLGVVGRIVFRRPWTIEARSDAGTVHQWRIPGWRAGERHCDEVAALLTTGVVAPGAATTQLEIEVERQPEHLATPIPATLTDTPGPVDAGTPPAPPADDPWAQFASQPPPTPDTGPEDTETPVDRT